MDNRFLEKPDADMMTDEEINSWLAFVNQKVGDDLISPEHIAKLYAEWQRLEDKP
jgi:hypothetical protein